MRMVALGDVADWGSGGTPKRSVSTYFGEGVPWLSIADLNDGVVTGAKESLTAAGVANSSAKVVPPGTIFVAMYGSIGKLGIAGTQMATSQAIAFAKPDEKLVDRRFLFQYLLAERPKLQALGRGGTQMNIGQADLKAWLMPLPSLPEQRRIAAILDHADALRATRRQLLTHLDALTQAIFHDMFGAGDFAQSPLREVIKWRSGKFLPAKQQRGGPHPVYGGNGINGTHDEYTFEEPQLVVGRVGAYCGVVHVTRPRAWVTDNALVATVLRDDLKLDYLLHALTIANLNQFASVSGQPSISGGAIGDLLLPIPPLALQAEFVRRIDQIKRHLALVARTASSDDELFASLQARAFDGRL